MVAASSARRVRKTFTKTVHGQSRVIAQMLSPTERVVYRDRGKIFPFSPGRELAVQTKGRTLERLLRSDLLGRLRDCSLIAVLGVALE